MRGLATATGGLLRSSSFPGFAMMLLLIGVNAVITTGFLRLSSLVSLLNLITPLVCLSMGLGIAVLSGGLDISIGAVVCLVNVVLVTLSGQGTPLAYAVLAAVGAALAVGALNGIVIGYLRVNALLVTFATQSVAGGLALWIMPLPSGQLSPGFVEGYSSGTFLALPVALLVVLALLGGWGVLRLTPYGTYLLAVGRDEQKAYVSGIDTRRVLLVSYVLSALCAGIGGVTFSANIGGGDPLAGLSMTLNALAAVVIGGISLSGGRGGVLGCIFGAVFFALITETVLGASVAAFYQDLAAALIILAGVLGMNLLQRATAIADGYRT